MRETVVLMVSVPSIIEAALESAARSTGDVRLVARDGSKSLDLAVSQEEPDVVLLGLTQGSELNGFTDLLYERPRMRLFGIGAEGRDIRMCRLTPRFESVGNVSPTELIAAIRRREGS